MKANTEPLVWTYADHEAVLEGRKLRWWLGCSGGFGLPFPDHGSQICLVDMNSLTLMGGTVKKETLRVVVEEAVLQGDPLAIKALILLTTHNPAEYGEWKETAERLREVYYEQR